MTKRKAVAHRTHAAHQAVDAIGSLADSVFGAIDAGRGIVSSFRGPLLPDDDEDDVVAPPVVRQVKTPKR